MKENDPPTFKCFLKRAGMNSKIEFRGEDISRFCTSIEIKADVNSITSVTLQIMPEFIEVEIQDPVLHLRELSIKEPGEA